MKHTAPFLVALSLIVILPTCRASNATGTYVAHAATFTEMLQLTETTNGQITGVLSGVRMDKDGQIRSDQMEITGAVNAGQITVTIHSNVIFSSTLAGTISGAGIQLQEVDSSGNMSTETLVRSTPAQFKNFADELRAKGAGIVLSDKLLSNAEQLRAIVRNAESWTADAETHAGRIPAVKSQYDKIESQMRSLVVKEEATSDAVTRSQISVAVSQGDISGEQVDLQVEQIWDIGIANTGANLNKAFTAWDGNCRGDQLQTRGATAHAIDEWESACNQALAEREKFMPVYKRIMEQRADLQSFEKLAEAHRKALVQEADNIH